jgi:thiol-disulfide isomerase/thioredoxin
VGKTIPLSGKTLDGRTVSLANYAGRVVLIHYWATWCEPCEADIKQIKELHAKFAPQGFAVLGVNFDSSSQAPLAQLKKDPLPWLHIHDAGGLEGRLANELGILTLPTMILVDPQGKVIRRNIHISEIEPAFKQHLRTASRPSR